MYLAWRYGGNDPYRLFHGLDENFVPLDEPEAGPQRPLYPGRLRDLIYGFATTAESEDRQKAGAQAAARGMGR